MIHTISQILINGSNSIFGGFVYSCRLQIKYGDGQSTVSISVISENGTFQISPSVLSNTFCIPYSIQVGSKITFIGYLESYSQKKSPQGNTLSLFFVDSSHILDVTQVGLYKRYGTGNVDTNATNGIYGITEADSTFNNPSWLIVCGFEIDPCNSQNYVNPEANFFDPCSPCINDQAQEDIKNYVDCEEKAKYEIHDVKYNFSELLSKIQIPIIGAADPNPSYLQQYTGSLREVLNQWCQDFGFFFYWNNGVIVIQDLRNTIQVNATIENFCPNLLEYNETYSMKDSVATATLTNFSRPGDPAKLYDCQSAKYVILTSLVQNSAYSMPLTITPKIDKVGAGLTYYSPDLRDLYYWYILYQMYDTTNIKAGKQLPKLGLTILSDPITFSNKTDSTYSSIDDAPTPDEMNQTPGTDSNNNSRSKDPFLDSNNEYLNSDQQSNVQLIMQNQDFWNCVQLLDIENKWKIVDKPDNYYFFLAEHNQTEHQKSSAEDRDFAGFLNKYAVFVPDPSDTFFEDYDFELDNLCGIKYFVNTGSVSYEFLGDSMGSLKFYNTSVEAINTLNGTPMSELPFARFLSIIHDNSNESSNNQLTNLGGFLSFKLIVATRGRNSFVPEGVTATGDGSASAANALAIQDYTLLSQISKYLPFQLANKNNLSGDFIGRILQAGDDTNSASKNDVFLYLACNVSQDDFRLTQTNGYNNEAAFGTLFDGKPLNKATDPTLQFDKIIYQYPELQCSIIGNNSFQNRFALHANVVNFKTPAGTFTYTEPTDALFGTVIEKHKRTRRIVEKVESFFLSNNNINTCNVNKIKLNYRDISDDTLKMLTKINTICEFDANQILSVHKKFTANLSVNYTQPTISKTFKIAGVDLNNYTPTIANGLLSVDISVDDKGGVSSTYELGTRLMILPQEAAVVYSQLNLVAPHGSYTNTVNYFPTLGQPNL